MVDSSTFVVGVGDDEEGETESFQIGLNARQNRVDEE